MGSGVFVSGHGVRDTFGLTSIGGLQMPLSPLFTQVLDTVALLPHATSTHSAVWSLPEDLAAATFGFRRLWELGERAQQDEITHYLLSRGISSDNARQIQWAWETIDFCLSHTPSRGLHFDFLPPSP